MNAASATDAAMEPVLPSRRAGRWFVAAYHYSAAN
jgi:hypothetical protein